MSCDRFTKPIAGTGVTQSFPTASNSLADLGITLNGNTGRVVIDVDGDPLVPAIKGRFWETGQDPTTSEGNPIQSGQQIDLLRSQALGFKAIAIGSAFIGQITEYESETV